MIRIKNFIEDKKMSNYFVFKFEKGEHKNEIYKTYLSIYCDNPTCNCTDILLSISSFNENDEEDDNIEKDYKYRFCLNTEKREISEKNDNISLTERNFAESFLMELSDNDWSDFYLYFLAFKGQIIENCDYKKLDYDFSILEKEDESLIGFGEVFPYSLKYYIDIDKDKYTAIHDHYCINPDCSCHDSVLSIIEYDKTRNYKDVAEIIYNYNNGTWESFDKNKVVDQKVINEILNKFKEKYSDFKEKLKKRHKILKELYLKYSRKNNILSNNDFEKVISNKIGRNDPCSCGSGKKYKKCCGA